MSQETEVATERMDDAGPPANRPRIGVSDPAYPTGDKQYLYAQAAKKYPLSEIRIRQKMIVYDYLEWRYMQRETDPRPRRRKLHEYKVVRKLGSGGFGTVVAVRVEARKHVDNHRFDEPAQMALKTFDKRSIRKHGEVKNIYDLHPQRDYKNVEMHNLVSLPWYPFVAGLVDTYSDTRNIYLLTELGHAGSFSDHISQNAPFCTSASRFYFANIVAALEFVHGEGLVHGDVKSDNLFIGADGYLMLGDFGMARHQDVDDALWETMGTLQFIPPEHVRSLPVPKEQRRFIDWWGAICILYEMATGKLTFPQVRKHQRPLLDTRSEDEELRQRIIDVRYYWPQNVQVDKDLKDLVNRMLKKDPAERYGVTRILPAPTEQKTEGRPVTKNNGRDSINIELRRHAFFHTFPWNALKEKLLVAPYVPDLEPDMRQGWQCNKMPPQHEVPFLSVQWPAKHFQWDNRCSYISPEERPHNRDYRNGQEPPAKRRRIEEEESLAQEDEELKVMMREVRQHLSEIRGQGKAVEEKERIREQVRRNLTRDRETRLEEERRQQRMDALRTLQQARRHHANVRRTRLNSPGNPFAPDGVTLNKLVRSNADQSRTERTGRAGQSLSRVHDSLECRRTEPMTRATSASASAQRQLPGPSTSKRPHARKVPDPLPSRRPQANQTNGSPSATVEERARRAEGRQTQPTNDRSPEVLGSSAPGTRARNKENRKRKMI